MKRNAGMSNPSAAAIAAKQIGLPGKADAIRKAYERHLKKLDTK